MSAEDRAEVVALYMAAHPDVVARLFVSATPGGSGIVSPPQIARPRGSARTIDDLPAPQQAAMRQRFMDMWQRGDPKRGRQGSSAEAIAWLLDPEA